MKILWLILDMNMEELRHVYLVKTTVNYWQDDWGDWATGDEACGSPFKSSYRHIFLKHLALWEGMQLLVIIKTKKVRGQKRSQYLFSNVQRLTYPRSIF